MAKLKPMIFGGSFDPFHNAHLALIKCSIKEGYRPIYIIPTYISPVNKKMIAPFEERLILLKKGTTGMENVIVSEFEKKQNKICYSIDQVNWIKSIHENQKISLLLGEDNLKDMKSWKNYNELIKSCNIVVARRMEAEINNKTTVLNFKIMKISSSEIRKKIKEGKPISGTVPKAVEEEISKRNLYK